jgi:hypothetical protein
MFPSSSFVPASRALTTLAKRQVPLAKYPSFSLRLFPSSKIANIPSPGLPLRNFDALRDGSRVASTLPQILHTRVKENIYRLNLLSEKS